MLEKIIMDVLANRIVILLLQLAALIVALAIVFVLIKHILTKRKKWGDLKKKFRSHADGIVFGRIPWKGRVACSPTQNEGHIIVTSPSGGGKTAGLLIPTLRAWQGSIFVIDISGDICKRIPDPNKVVYAPESENAGSYSPFAAIDTATTAAEKNERLQQLSFALIPDAPSADDTTAFYNDESRKLLQAALIAFYHAGLDFVLCCKKIISCNAGELLTHIMSSKNTLALQLAVGFEGTNEKTLAATLQEIHKALMLFATNENITATLQRGGSSPQTLENSSLYVVVSDEKLELYAPLLRLITVQTLGYLSARENGTQPKILCALDEFASLGKLDILPALRKLRKKNVRIMALTQSLADLDLIYGEKQRRAMLENFEYKAILGCGDVDTMKYFSDLAGEKFVKKTTINKKIYTDTGLFESETELNTRGESISEQLVKELPPEELRTLAARRQLILIFPEGVLRLKKYFYFDKLLNKKFPFVRVPYKMPMRKIKHSAAQRPRKPKLQLSKEPLWLKAAKNQTPMQEIVPAYKLAETIKKQTAAAHVLCGYRYTDGHNHFFKGLPMNEKKFMQLSAAASANGVIIHAVHRK